MNSRTMIPSIRVLIVDDDRESRLSTARMLEQYSYQTTVVDLASRAMKMISSGKKHFDVVIVDLNSDVDGFQFCQQVAKLGSLVLLTSAMEDARLATKAIENGAFLFTQKPVNEHIMKYLWQFVIKERLQQSKGQQTTTAETGARMIINCRGQGVVINECKGTNMNGVAIMEIDKGNIQKRIYKKRKEPENVMMNPYPAKKSSRESHFAVNQRRNKPSTECTKELHEKFMKAVEQLGHGNCYPKEILELMNVPGLTRMQVASHLQKCRHDNWRAPEERRHRSRMHRSFSAENEVKEKERMRVFGSMPRRKDKSLVENQQSSQHIPLHFNSASSGTTNTTVSSNNPENEGSSILTNGFTNITAFDLGSAEFGLEIPIYTADDDLLPKLDLTIDEISSIISDIDMPLGPWNDIPLGPPPPPAHYPANMSFTNTSSCSYTVIMPIALGAPAPSLAPAQYPANLSFISTSSDSYMTMPVALGAPAAPVVGVDFNQHASIPLPAPEPAFEVESFFNQDAPDFLIASWPDNDSKLENSNNDLPPNNP